MSLLTTRGVRMLGLLSRFQVLNLLPAAAGKLPQNVASANTYTASSQGFKRFQSSVAFSLNSSYSTLLLNQTSSLLCTRSPGLVNQSRSVTKFSRARGTMRSATIVTSRFKRLGNGLWIRRQAGYKHKAWRKRLKCRGPQIKYRQMRHIICTTRHNKLFDRMVKPYFKQQRWTVTDPYKGYDADVKFYYNPFDIPGVNKGRRNEWREYYWRRAQYERSHAKQIQKKQGVRAGTNSTRRKLIQNTNYFH